MDKDNVKFSGCVYIRPCSRGISIESADRYNGWDLADIFEEGKTYEIEVKAKKLD
jgi:hypothetical protein